jgi:hypothetical protein
MMAVIGFTGVWPLAVAMCAIGFQQIHFHSQWFFTLPVSRHKLFAIWGLPLLVIMAVCPALKIYWGLFFSGAPQFTASGVARIVLVYAAVVLGTSLLSVFLVNFTSWRRIGRTLRKTVPPIYLVTLLVGLGTALMWQLFSHTPHSRELLGASTLAWALRILPHDIVALTGTVIIVLGSLYWIVSKQFCELEILPVQMKDLRTS